MSDSAYTTKLIDIIDEYYLYYSGPVGSIICGEAFEEWANQHSNLHYGFLPRYIDLLLAEIPPKQQAQFVEDLKGDETISSFIALNDYLNSL